MRVALLPLEGLPSQLRLLDSRLRTHLDSSPLQQCPRLVHRNQREGRLGAVPERPGSAPRQAGLGLTQVRAEGCSGSRIRRARLGGQQSGGMFGQTQQQPQTAGIFGGTTNPTSTFASTPQNPQTNTFGGFGAPKPAFGTGTTGGFGSSSTNTFGQQPQNPPTSTFSFGQNNQQQPQQQSTGGIFGSTNTQNTGTGIFGASNQQQNPQSTGNLFGANNAAKPGGIFGNPGTTGATGGSTFSECQVLRILLIFHRLWAEQHHPACRWRDVWRHKYKHRYDR